jgi:hypothetical protein
MALVSTIAMAVVLAGLAYGVCVLLVLGVAWAAANFFGGSMVSKGRELPAWHLLNLLAWVGASLLAGWIAQAPVGFSPLLPTCILASLLFVMLLRSAMIMRRQRPIAMQIVLCVLCPAAVFAAWAF